MDLVFIVLVVYVIINFIIAQKMQSVAILKGYGPEAHIFSTVFWLGIIGLCIVGCIYVAALPDKVLRSQSQEILESLRKQEDSDTTDKE